MKERMKRWKRKLGNWRIKWAMIDDLYGDDSIWLAELFRDWWLASLVDSKIQKNKSSRLRHTWAMSNAKWQCIVTLSWKRDNVYSDTAVTRLRSDNVATRQRSEDVGWITAPWHRYNYVTTTPWQRRDKAVTILLQLLQYDCRDAT